MEGLRDGSGLFAIFPHREAAALAWDGLSALQHRGTAVGSIVVSDGVSLRGVREVGRVHEVFPRERARRLSGRLALAQVTGGYELVAPEGAEPWLPDEQLVTANYADGPIAVAMAGRFMNGQQLRRDLAQRGGLFQGDSEAELLLHLVAQSGQRTLVNRLVDALWRVQGAYAVILAVENRLVAVRDPRGIRPLLLGEREGAAIVASEDRAIRAAGGAVVREVAPGEMIIVEREGVKSVRPFAPHPPARCIQERLRLARADSSAFGVSAYERRVALGMTLAEANRDILADVVVSMPGDEPLGLGYARGSSLPWERGLVPLGPGRDGYSSNPAAVRGRRVVLVAGALLTGRGIREAVSVLLSDGAIEVFLCIASPPMRDPCAYGVPSPMREELVIALRNDAEELRAWLGATQVTWLEREAFLGALDRDGEGGWCSACLGGMHPIAPDEGHDQLALFDSGDDD